MPLKKLVFKTGVNRDQTAYAGEGGWYSCNRIRFLSGFPQKIGGWAKASLTSYLGTCRTLFNWIPTPGYNYLALGTSSKIYIDNGGTLNDITPIRATFAAGTVSFTTAVSSTTVLVTTTTAHGGATGDYVVFSGSTDANGIPATSLNNVQFSITVVSPTTFNITANTAATSAGAGGGAAIVGYFYIATGFSTAASGTGWGAPVWGGGATALPGTLSVSTGGQFTLGTATSGLVVGQYVYISGTNTGTGSITGYTNGVPQTYRISVTNGTSTFTLTTTSGAALTTTAGSLTGLSVNVASSTGTGWGIASNTAVSVPLQYVYFASRYNAATNRTNLLFNIRNGKIYQWAVDTAFQVAPTTSPTNATALTGTSVPTQVGQILYDTYSGILMAFGATSYGAYANFDPLLVRWASQDDYTNWDPATPYTSTAGFLKLQTGSNILRAYSNLGEIIAFTESSLTAVTFVGGLDVFGQKLVSADVSVIGPNAISLKNNVYYWMGTDKFYLYNGRVETIPCTLRQHVFENINLAQAEQVVACSNERFFEVWWFYCSASSDTIDRYVIYNYAEECWYYGTCTDSTVPGLDLSRTAWSDSPLRQYPQAAGGASNYLYSQEYGVNADGVAMTSYIQSADVDIDDGDNFMLIRRIIPDVSFTGSTPVTGTPPNAPSVNMGFQLKTFPGSQPMVSNAEGQDFYDTAYSTNVTYDIYTEQLFVRGRGRQIQFYISSTALDVNWQLGAVRIDMRPDGRRGNTGSGQV